MILFYNYIRKLLVLGVLLSTWHGIIAQIDYIPPQIINNNDAIIEWQEDGSVKVIGGPVKFISGIAPAPQENQIKDYQMILVDETAYFEDETQSGIDYGMSFSNIRTTTQEGNISITPADLARLKVHRRPALSSSNPNTAGNGFGYGTHADDKYLVYGTEYTNENGYNNWDVFSYIASGWNRHKKSIKSNDYRQLWHRPNDVSWWWTAAEYSGSIFVGLGLLTGITELIFEGAAIGEAFNFAVGAITVAYGVIIASGLTYVVAMGTLATMGYYDNNTQPDYGLNSANLMSQIEFNTSQELILPNKFEGTDLNNYQKKHNEIVNRLSFEAHDCFNYTKKCYYAPIRDVVVEMDLKDVHLKSVSIPGSIYKILTPYQIFAENKFHYVPENNGEIFFDPTNNSAFTSVDASAEFGGVEYVLPDNLIKNTSGSTQEATIEFDSYLGPKYFYLVDKEIPYNSPNYIFYDLGVYGELNGVEYRLYRFHAKFENQNDQSLTLSFNPDGPYLAGDNIISDNPLELEINQKVVIDIDKDLDPAIYENDNKAEVTINGVTLIYDEDDKDNTYPLLGDEYYSLYVASKDYGATDEEGNPKRALGIVTENYALLDTSDYLVLPDYVFEADYVQQSLFDLEAFVIQNKHLPYVPGIKQVEEDKHYRVSAMLMGQLRHLEELYLHAIEQQTKLDALNNDKHKLMERLLNIKNRIQQIKKN